MINQTAMVAEVATVAEVAEETVLKPGGAVSPPQAPAAEAEEEASGGEHLILIQPIQPC